MAQVNIDGNRCLFLHEQLAHLHTANTQKKVSNMVSDEDIMENNWAAGHGFDPLLPQTKVFKTGSSSFPSWRSGLWE